LSSDDLVCPFFIHWVEPVSFCVVFIYIIEKDDLHPNYVYLEWTVNIIFDIEIFRSFIIFFTFELLTIFIFYVPTILHIKWPRNLILYDSAENAIFTHLSPLNVLANLSLGYFLSFYIIWIIFRNTMERFLFVIKMIHRARPTKSSRIILCITIICHNFILGYCKFVVIIFCKMNAQPIFYSTINSNSNERIISLVFNSSYVVFPYSINLIIDFVFIRQYGFVTFNLTINL
jgi:hypothetical protein